MDTKKKCNVAVGKIGRVIAFNPDKWSPVGGDAEAPPYLEQIFLHNPQNTYYLVGSTDWQSLSQADRDRINKHGNVIDVWAGFKEWTNKNKDKWDLAFRRVEYMNDWMEEHKDLQFDYGLIFAGPASLSSIPGYSRLMTNPSQLAKPLIMCSNYAGPITKFLNDHPDLKYILIGTDQKYVPGSQRDMFNVPHMVMSQWNEVHTFKVRENYESTTMIETEVPAFYSGIETSFLIDLERRKDEPEDTLESFFGTDPEEEEQIRFMVVSNEWKGNNTRYKMLKEAILDHMDDVHVYGKWSKETVGDDPRFKGVVEYQDYLKLLKRTKYSYVATTSIGYPTPKMWELIHNGVIPFMHPVYDKYRLIPKPEYLYVKNGSEMKEKMDFLDANPAEYEKLLAECKAMIKPEFYNGDYLNNITNKFIEMLDTPREEIVKLLKK